MARRRPPGALPRIVTTPRLSDTTDFAYHATDAEGLRCPIGAHVRRSNPRDSLDPDPGTQKSIDVGNRHRLLRRGREYGPVTTPEEIASGVDDGIERGLHFACLNANIARQFEFIQRTWVNNPKFSGLYEDADPLVAAQAGRRGRLHHPRPAGPYPTDGPAPVRHRAGRRLFFLPGLKAIRYLAGLGS